MKQKRARRALCASLCALLLAGSLFLPSTSASAAAVNVTDPNLKAALVSALGGKEPATDNMAALTTLDLSGKGIADLTGLEAAVNLTQLSLRNNRIKSIAALSGLTSLCTLDLAGNSVDSVVPLASMSALRVLHLTDNEVDSLVPLELLKKLQFLFCEQNRLDLSGGAATASVTTLASRGCYVVTGTQKTSGGSDDVVTDADIAVRPGSGAKIDRGAGFVSGIQVGTPVTSVQTLLDGGSCTLRVLAADGAAAAGSFATGMTVELVNSVGTVLDKLTVVIYGDVNGNGAIDVGDMVLVNQHVLETRVLSGAYYEAGNVAGKVNGTVDTTLNVGDLVILNQIILNLRTITQ